MRMKLLSFLRQTEVLLDLDEHRPPDCQSSPSMSLLPGYPPLPPKASSPKVPPTSRLDPTCMKAVGTRRYLVYETKGCFKYFILIYTRDLQEEPTCCREIPDTTDTSVFTYKSTLTPHIDTTCIHCTHIYHRNKHTTHKHTHTPQLHTRYIPAHTVVHDCPLSQPAPILQKNIRAEPVDFALPS